MKISLCMLSQSLSLQYCLVTTGKSDSSRRTSGTTTMSKRETESRTAACRWFLITQTANQLIPGHLTSHAQHPRKETLVIPASQRESQGSEQLKSPSELRLGVTSLGVTQVYVSVIRFILYTLYALSPKGQMAIS